MFTALVKVTFNCCSCSSHYHHSLHMIIILLFSQVSPFCCSHRYHRSVVLTGITVLLFSQVSPFCCSHRYHRSPGTDRLHEHHVLHVAKVIRIDATYHQLYLQPPYRLCSHCSGLCHHCQTTPHGGGGYKLSSVVSSASPSLSNYTTWRRWV